MNQQFIISTFSKQDRLMGRVIWDSHKPMGLGYPFRLILEKGKTEKGQDRIRIWDLQGGLAEEVSEDTLSGKSFPFGRDSKFTIAPVRHAEIAQSWSSEHVDSEMLGSTAEARTFRKLLVGSLSGLGVILLSAVTLSMFIKPSEELVPAQFAKVILTPPRISGSQGSKARANQEKEKGSRSVNLVQAFKAPEVQKSTQKLLTGGVLALLAKSNFLPDGKSKAMVSAVFDGTKNKKSLASLSPLLESNPMNVNVLGGTGAGGNGNSVGYGKGGQAVVQGQGNSFVALNTPDAMVDEGLSKDEVGKVIHSHLAEVRYCYESAMIRNPSVQGKLVADFVIQGGGLVKNAKVNMSNVGDVSLDQCIIDRLFKWKFPRPRGGIDVAVVYPFIFKSLGK